MPYSPLTGNPSRCDNSTVPIPGSPLAQEQSRLRAWPSGAPCHNRGRVTNFELMENGGIVEVRNDIHIGLANKRSVTLHSPMIFTRTRFLLPAIELPVKDLLPGPKVQLSTRNGDHNLSAHDPAQSSGGIESRHNEQADYLATIVKLLHNQHPPSDK
jgi:hypothetical protein